VLRMLHPALESHPGHALWKRDYTGASGLFSVVLKPVPQKAVSHSSTRSNCSESERRGRFRKPRHSVRLLQCPHRHDLGTGGPAVRFHVGLEAVEDLLADLERGFAALAAASNI